MHPSLLPSLSNKFGPPVVLIFAHWQRCTYRGPVRRRSRVRLRTEEPLFLSLFSFFSFSILVIVVLFCFVSLDSDSFFPFQNYLPSCPISLVPYFLLFPPMCSSRSYDLHIFSSSSGYLQNLSTKSFCLFLVRIVPSPFNVSEK